jgi:hypothetical protein
VQEAHIDDAALQQFVNAKTQRPVTFRYETATLDGVSIGIISIPVQERPVYLLEDYGRLKREAVYIRRGSSTTIASPKFIAWVPRLQVEIHRSCHS